MSLDIQQQTADSNTDIREKGRRNGQTITSDRRLFVQFLTFGGCRNIKAVSAALEEAAIPGALYSDINDARGIGLAVYSEDPDFFVTTLRNTLAGTTLGALTPKPEYTMLGRSYAIGYESDLEETLIRRPIRRLTDPALRWVVWYPVRRSGRFQQLSADEQRTILMEHGGIGRSFGKAGLAHDIRLACFGLDKNDNDFVIGLVGSDLFPLSSVVERMRKTRQTAEFLTNLGPFFVGKVAWQSKLPDIQEETDDAS